MKLDPRVTTTGVRLITHAVLDSTNAQALSLAQRGEQGPLWIVAERQTAGRGRRGRAWVSQSGNLFASLLLTAVAPSERQPQLSLVAALALHDALVEVAPSLKPLITIKWPNDLLLRGMKMAGILIETAGGKNGAVAIGIGVNCASHPASTDYRATDLAAAGVAISPAMLFAPLSLKMAGRLAQWNGGEGVATVRADWLARAAGIGEEIRVQLVDRELSGRFETLDQAGSLVLRLPSGDLKIIAAADVFMLAS